MHHGRWRSAGVLALAAAAAGCGGGGAAKSPQATSPGSTGPVAAGPRTTSPGSTGSSKAGDVAVIRGWSSALARGNVAVASTYFATPSLLQVDPNMPAIRLRNVTEVRAANQAFPCGARLLSTRTVNGYDDALFVLGDRPGGGPGGCGAGTGLTARVAFVIMSGRIAQWRRIPDEPGDAAHRAPGTQAPPAAQPGGPGVSAI